MYFEYSNGKPSEIQFRKLFQSHLSTSLIASFETTIRQTTHTHPKKYTYKVECMKTHAHTHNGIGESRMRKSGKPMVWAMAKGYRRAHEAGKGKFNDGKLNSESNFQWKFLRNVHIFRINFI